jgi:oligopeptide/dipeptide ABC transporter ATP-binding protein
MQVLRQLQEDFELSYLFITHDLALVPQIARRVLVMYGGRIVEAAGVDELFARPLHPYSRLLLTSVPSLTGRRRGGRDPLPEAEEAGMAGCRFAPRCPFATDNSFSSRPLLEDVGGHLVACHNWETVEGDVHRDPVPTLDRDDSGG